MEITIEVRGQARTTVIPELAHVDAAVTADGPKPGPVKELVAALVRSVRQELDALGDAVIRYAVAQVQVSQHRPWNEQGEQLPLVYTATAGVTAEFADLEALGRWVLTDGLIVHGLDWRLTEATRAQIERQVRQDALREAVVRAQDYADTLSLGPVSLRIIRDAGMAVPGMQPRMLMAAAEAGRPTVELSAEPLEIDAEVHATFVVGTAT